MDAVAGGFGALGARRGVRRAGAVLLVVVLLLVWSVTYLAGGTRTVLPHLFYVPIMVSALFFGFPGGVAAAVVATLLCWPLMPFEVASGQGQGWVSWVSRGAFFLVVGSLAGEMLRHRSVSYEQDLFEQFQREIDLATAAPAPT